MKTAEISAHYMDHMGSDLTVVNAARASFDKESTWEPGNVLQKDGGRRLRPADANLIRYLSTGYRSSEWAEFLDEVIKAAYLHDAKTRLTDLLHAYKRRAQHWAPFGHPHLQLRMTLPVFLARQYVKHQVGGVWSEVSRRYIDEEPSFWFPKEWHTRPEDVKQGSGGLAEDQSLCHSEAAHSVDASLTTYRTLLSSGVAPEEARIVLPLDHMTTVVWTGSLLFWSRVVNQRVDGHAQRAAEELGRLISGIVQPHFPVSWAALTTPH